MSDTGLYSGLYSKVRGMAELVDQVILDLRSPINRSDSTTYRVRLAALLAGLADPDSGDLTSNILNVILRDAPRCNLNASALGEQLLQPGDSQDIVDKLEVLASILEAERSTMHSKMRGL
jgi:hypothetical protein